MATLQKKDVQEIVDNAIESFAQIINSAFIKQDEVFDNKLGQRLEEQKIEIMAEIDSRGYVTKQDLDDRGYVTKHDLDDAILDLKDNVVGRITRLEEKVR